MKIPKWVWIVVALVVSVPLILVLLGILAGFLFPAASTVMSKAQKAHAETTAANLKNAIDAYYTEYREYPLVNAVDDVTGDSGHALMDILLGADKHKDPGGRNLRGIAFFTDRAAKPMSDGRFRKGLTLDADGGGELWDLWGKFYRVRFDSNFDNRLENPEAPGTLIPESIAVWSAGPDGDFDTWKDNVKTW